jgi:hypothetical protein
MFENIWWSSRRMSIINNGIFNENYSHTKFHEKPTSGSHVVPCGQVEGPTSMTNLIVFFFAIFGTRPTNIGSTMTLLNFFQ